MPWEWAIAKKPPNKYKDQLQGCCLLSADSTSVCVTLSQHLIGITTDQATM